MGWNSLWTVSACAAVLGCGAGDTRLDPGDLELRDLLGVSTDVATTWDADQRAAARRVLGEGLETRAELPSITLGEGRTLDERVLRALTDADRSRRAAGDDALGLVHVQLAGDRATATAPAGSGAYAVFTGAGTQTQTEIWVSERWHDDLPGRGLDLLGAIARDAGHATGPVVVTPGPRMPVIATYVDGHDAPARLLVNPVLLASLEPLTDVTEPTPIAEPAIAPSPSRAQRDEVPRNPDGTVRSAGNPYSFYGSVNECAAAQRGRCESCLPAGNCEAITAGTDGETECTALGNNNGRGYFLICINLSLAITSVERCAAESAPGCPRDLDAASELTEIENNANFLDDSTCAGALDGCLAEIYGAPPDEFPGLSDGGVIPPPRPPRDTNVSCSDSCDNSNNNCDASAGSCGSGPSCGNSFSCDGACSSSNDQSGCDGNCNACSSDDSGSGGSSGCGGEDSGGGDSCGGDSGGGGDSCGGGDSGSGCGGGGDSGGSCGGGDSGGGGGCGGGGDSGGGGCGGGGGSSSGCGGGGGGGSSSSSCNVARRQNAGSTLVASLAWAMLPIPAAAFVRRRSRKKPKPSGPARVPGSPRDDDEEVQS